VEDDRAGVPRGSALLTDLYQLTMMNGYLEHGEEETRAAFDLFFRRAVFGGRYLVVAGLEDAVRFLQELVFTGDEIEYLRSLELFGDEFLEYLSGFRFTGDLHAMPEGTPVFPGEPVLRIEAPLLEGQLVETALLNIVGYQTLIATKASRVVRAADGDPVIDFGLRRAHGTNGAFLATRAAFIGGVQGTSNVLAGRRLGIPVRGTMAHSWMLSFDSELEAFRAYADVYPEGTILLLDTYDTLRSGLPNALTVAGEMREQGHRLLGVRLDSGELTALSLEVRERLDRSGLEDALVFASGDMDEHRIAALKAQGACIDAWGVGTRLITAHGDPGHSGVYKLAAVERDGAWTSKHKVSDEEGKATLPGRKQVWRRFGDDGLAESDLIALHDEPVEHGEADALLVPVLEGGELLGPLPTLEAAQVRARAELDQFASGVLRLDEPGAYPVEVSAGIEALRSRE